MNLVPKKQIWVTPALLSVGAVIMEITLRTFLIFATLILEACGGHQNDERNTTAQASDDPVREAEKKRCDELVETCQPESLPCVEAYLAQYCIDIASADCIIMSYTKGRAQAVDHGSGMCQDVRAKPRPPSGDDSSDASTEESGTGFQSSGTSTGENSLEFGELARQDEEIMSLDRAEEELFFKDFYEQSSDLSEEEARAAFEKKYFSGTGKQRYRITFMSCIQIKNLIYRKECLDIVDRKLKLSKQSNQAVKNVKKGADSLDQKNKEARELLEELRRSRAEDRKSSPTKKTGNYD